MRYIYCTVVAVCLVGLLLGCKDDGPQVGRYVPIYRDGGLGMMDTTTGTVRFPVRGEGNVQKVHEFRWTPQGMTHRELPLKKIDSN